MSASYFNSLGMMGYGPFGIGQIGPDGQPIPATDAAPPAVVARQGSSVSLGDPSALGYLTAPSAAPTFPASLPYAGADLGPQPSSAPPSAPATATGSPGAFASYKAAMRSGESGGDPSAQNPNSSASGSYEFTGGTFDQFLQSSANQKPGGGQWTAADKNDPAAQEAAMDWLTNQNAGFLQNRLGRSPTDAELAAAHLMGASGALSAIQNPDANAYSTYAGATNPKLADAAFASNGKLLDRNASNADILSRIGSYYLNGRKPGGGSTPAPAQDAPDEGQAVQQAAAAAGTTQPAQARLGTAPMGQLPGYGTDMLGAQAFAPKPITESDKLLGMAAGLFGGETAGEGISAGLKNVLALNQQDRENQLQASKMNVDLTRLGITDRQSQAMILANMARLDQGQQRIDQSGQRAATQAQLGQQRLDLAQQAQGTRDRVAQASMSGQTAANQADARASSKDNFAQAQEIDKDGEAAVETLPRLQQISQTLATSGAGPDTVSQFKRVIAQKLGMQIGDTDPSSSQLSAALLAQQRSGYLQQTMHGLGLRNQREFDSFVQGVAGLDSRPDVLKDLIAPVQQKAQFDYQTYQAWHDPKQTNQADLLRQPLGVANWMSGRTQTYAQSRGVSPDGTATPTLQRGADGGWTTIPAGQGQNPIRFRVVQ